MLGAPSGSLTHRISFWILAIVLAGAPLPYGSRDQSVVAFWCGLLGVGLILASVQGLRRPHCWVLATIGLIAAGYAFVLHEQLSTVPWVATFHPVWAEAARLLDTPVEPSVSIVRYEPFFALGAPLANGLVLTLGLLVGTDRRAARALLTITAWAGVVYAVYGLYGMIFDPGTILGREKTAYIGNLTGTFINRNTAATYFGSVTILWFVVLLEKMRERLPSGTIPWGKLAREVSEDRAFQRSVLVPFVMLFLCLTATFLTVSRAGSTLTVFVLALVFVLFFRRRLRSRGGLLIAGGAAVAVALMVLHVLAGNVASRFEINGISDAGRIAVWQSTLKIIADHPWFGTGLGTFVWAIPLYRSPEISMWGTWDMAHSTPLELASDVGIPLALVVGCAWVGALAALFNGARERRRDKVIPLAALGVALFAIIHSTVDFSLQVAGYAMVAFGIVGIGLAQAFRSSPGPANEAGAAPIRSS